MEETENPANSGDSDTTGEQTEGSEDDNEPPVIKDEDEPADPPAEAPTEEPVVTPEEPVVTPEEPVEDSIEEIGSSIMGVETMAVTDITATAPTGDGYTAALAGVDSDGKLQADTDLELTVTANTGYKVKSVSWAIDDTSQGSLTEENGKYTIPSATLTEKFGDVTSGNITFTVTVVEIFDVTVTVDTLANIQTLASVVDGKETAIDSVQASNTVTVEKDTVLSLKVVPAADYEVTVEVDGTAKTGSNDVYEIGTISAATTVVITTAKIVNSYAVTETIKTNGSAAADASKVATIEYTANCVKEDSGAKTIAKGTDLTFKVNEVPGEGEDAKGSFDGKVVDVSYTIGGGEEKPLTKDANGIYKVEKDVITDAVAIIVNVRDLADVQVAFTGVDTAQAKVSYKAADAAGDYAELTNNATTATIKEGQTFNLKVEPKDVYQIDKVTVKHGSKDAEKLDATGGVYSFVATKDNVVIGVEASYDETKVNRLAFKVEGDAASYQVAKTAITDDSDGEIDDLNDPADGSDYQIGETVLTKATKLKVTLTPDASYDITKVALGTETLYDATREADKGKDAAGPYTIDYGTASVSAKELTVTTKAKTSDKDIRVYFKKGFNNTVVDYNVVTGNTVEKNEDDGSYTIKAGEGYLKFDVTTVGKYTPAVTVNEDAVEAPEKTEGKYSYTYLVAKLKENGKNTIVVDAKIAQKTVTLVYEDAQVDVSAAIGNTPQAAVNKVYTVDDGAKLSFKVTAKDNYVIDKVTTKGAAADAEVNDITLANGRFNLTVEEDTTVTITSKGILSQKALVDKSTGEEPAKDKKGAYVVSNNGTYVGGAVEGSTDVAITSVKLFDGSKEVAETSGEGDSAVKNWSVNANKTEITLFPSNAIAGKKLTLKMYRQVAQTDADGKPATGDDGKPVMEDKEVASYTLAVAANLDVARVKINDIKQATDTEAEYAITVNAGADVNKIKAGVAAADVAVVKSAVVEDGKLKVTTGFTAGTAKIKLYTLKDEKAADTEANQTLVKEVNVTTTALIDKDTTKAPKIGLVSATDVSMVLSLDASALKLKDTATGAVYYEIKATANGEVPKNGTTELLKKEVIKYVPKTEDKQTTDLWFNTSGEQDSSSYGKGGHCKYDVEVRLVHLREDTEPASAADCLTKLAVAEKSFSASATTGTKPYETKSLYYEDKLKLKKGVSTLYTGQTAVIATPQFGKNTSYMAVRSVEDLTGGLDVDFDPDTNEITATADSRTSLGKHTIEVMAMSTDEQDAYGNLVSVPTMYAARATITVTVVRGIESLTVTVPSDKMFKDVNPKKAATMTAAVTYNRGATTKEYAPKTKKVNWALLNADGYVLSASDYLNGKLTVKNGKVTLAKDYVVSRTEKNNQFKIAAIAADFNRNVDTTPGVYLTETMGEVAISRTITITNDAMTIDSLAILDRTNKVIAKDGGTLEASQADGAKLVAFLPDAPVKAQYTSADLANYAAQASNVKFTSSNAKAVTIRANGTLSVMKPAKNVTLTATPGDGNPDKNAKKSIKLTVNYDTTGELGLQISKVEPDGNEYEISRPDNKTPEFTDSTVAYFALQVQQRNSDGEWDNVAPYANYTNYKLAVKGGKILYNNNDGTAEIATASAVTTITLTNNNVKPAAKAEYVLTNKGISGLAKGTKAPKVKINGTLQANYYEAPQYLKVQLTNAVKADKPGYIEDFSKLYVKVDFDWTSYNVKKPDAQDEFVYEMNPKGYMKVEKDGSFNLGFGEDDDYTNLMAGSYKIKINFGEIDEDGNFKSVAPASAQTIKVVNPKKLSFKPTTSYSISATDNGYAVLTGKGTYNSVLFSKLQNANIKGQENKFRRYFEIGDAIDKDGNEVQTIKLTPNYYADVNDPNVKLDFSDKKFKDDLTGYVTYAAYDLSGNEVTNTVKLTLKVSAPTAVLTKYALSTSGVVGTAAGSKVTVYVTDNKKNPVEIEDALYGGNEWNGTLFKGADGEATNVMEFAAKSALTAGTKYDIVITFLPADSYYVTEYNKVKADNTKKKEFLQKYGITLTTKVTAKDLATVNKGRIKVDAKNLSRTFTPYMFDGTSYYAYVAYDEVYTDTVINKITNNSVAVGSGEGAPQLIKIERVADTTFFKVSMSKALFDQAIKADVKADGKPKNTFYDAKGKAKTLSVKADVCYNAEATQKDSFTFKLTMPANPSAYTDQGADGLTAFEQAIDDLNKNKEAIADRVTVDYDYDMSDWNTKAAQWELYDEIVKAAGADSGINFDVCEDDENYAGVQKISQMLKVGSVTEPTSTTDGSLPITATLKGYAAGQTATIVFTLTIPKQETLPSDVSTEVSDFLSENTEKYAVNTVTEADILGDLRAHMKAWAPTQDPAIDLTNIRFRIDGFNVKKAGFVNGTPESGSVTGMVVIWNIHLDEAYDVTIDFDDIGYTIAAPVERDEVINAVKTALGIATEEGGANVEATIAELAVANTVDGVKADVLAVAQKAAGFAYTVEYQKDNNNDKFAFTPVAATTAGKISFTLVVKDGDGNYIGEEKNADGTIKTQATTIVLAETTLAANADIMTVAEAKKAVEAWVTKVTGENATDADKAVLTGTENESAAATAIATAAGVKSTVTVTVTDWEKIAATHKADGHVKGTVVLTKGGTTNQKEAKVDFALTVPKSNTWTMDTAEAEVKAAVENAGIYISNTNVKTDAGKAAVAAQMLAAAKAAVPETKFTVAIKQEGTETKTDVKLVVTNATEGKAGKATLVLVITEVLASDAAAGTTAATKEVTVEHAIPALPEGSGTIEPEVPEKTVTRVTVSADKENYTTGGTDADTVQFSAVVEGTNLTDSDKTVTWELVGTEGTDYASGTSIDATGKLTVATDETVEKLTIKAISTVDNSVSGTKEITKQS